jgi:hypothetical protein
MNLPAGPGSQFRRQPPVTAFLCRLGPLSPVAFLRHCLVHHGADRRTAVGLPPMRDQEQFDTFVRAGLAQYGAEVDAIELEIIRAAERVYGPERDRLLAADLSDVEPELALDPSRPPRELGSARRRSG